MWTIKKLIYFSLALLLVPTTVWGEDPAAVTIVIPKDTLVQMPMPAPPPTIVVAAQNPLLTTPPPALFAGAAGTNTVGAVLVAHAPVPPASVQGFAITNRVATIDTAYRVQRFVAVAESQSMERSAAILPQIIFAALVSSAPAQNRSTLSWKVVKSLKDVSTLIVKRNDIEDRSGSRQFIGDRVVELYNVWNVQKSQFTKSVRMVPPTHLVAIDHWVDDLRDGLLIQETAN